MKKQNNSTKNIISDTKGYSINNLYSSIFLKLYNGHLTYEKYSVMAPDINSIFNKIHNIIISSDLFGSFKGTSNSYITCQNINEVYWKMNSKEKRKMITKTKGKKSYEFINLLFLSYNLISWI